MNSLVVMPLIGGIIIGVTSCLMLFFLGKILGISSMSTAAFSDFSKRDQDWKRFFIFGLVLGGLLLNLLKPDLFDYKINSSILEIVLAGFLVGFGTRLGSGCTSGHGVCGIPRLSKRSISAALIFMFTGMITVFLMRLL